MIRNGIFRIRSTMYTVPMHKFNMADMLAWLTGSVQHKQTEQGQQHYRMYCIPKHIFKWRTCWPGWPEVCSTSRLNKVSSTTICTVYRSINSKWRTCWPGWPEVCSTSRLNKVNNTTVCTVYRSIYSNGGHAGLADRKCAAPTDWTRSTALPYVPYCIPKNKFNMADILAWLTWSVQHQQAEQGQQHYRMYCKPKHKFK